MDVVIAFNDEVGFIASVQAQVQVFAHALGFDFFWSGIVVGILQLIAGGRNSANGGDLASFAATLDDVERLSALFVGCLDCEFECFGHVGSRVWRKKSGRGMGRFSAKLCAGADFRCVQRSVESELQLKSFFDN